LTNAAQQPEQIAYQIDVQVDEEFAGLVDEGTLIDAVAEVLRLAGKTGVALTIAITDDDYVRQLNHDYLGVDAPTDVLSFGAQPDDEPTMPSLVVPAALTAELANYLGDLVIAYPYATQQAARYANSIAAELRLLAVHGTLHLLGYDHATPAAEAAMWAAQAAALARFGDQALAHRNHDA